MLIDGINPSSSIAKLPNYITQGELYHCRREDLITLHPGFAADDIHSVNILTTLYWQCLVSLDTFHVTVEQSLMCSVLLLQVYRRLTATLLPGRFEYNMAFLECTVKNGCCDNRTLVSFKLY